MGEREIERSIVDRLKKASGPCPTGDMIEALEAKGADPFTIRAALWHLISQGRILLTRERKIELPSQDANKDLAVSGGLV